MFPYVGGLIISNYFCKLEQNLWYTVAEKTTILHIHWKCMKWTYKLEDWCEDHLPALKGAICTVAFVVKEEKCFHFYSTDAIIMAIQKHFLFCQQKKTYMLHLYSILPPTIPCKRCWDIWNKWGYEWDKAKNWISTLRIVAPLYVKSSWALHT